MNPATVHIYHNRRVSHAEIESLFGPIFGRVYSYSMLLNMSDHVWCAYSNDQLIGCVLAKQSRNASILYLILFGIEKLYRSLGIGTYLLSAIVEYTRSRFYNRIYLHTECTNASAIGFYRKFHFHIDLYLENYYQTMTNFYPHAFRMSRKLHPVEWMRVYGRFCPDQTLHDWFRGFVRFVEEGSSNEGKVEVVTAISSFTTDSSPLDLPNHSDQLLCCIQTWNPFFNFWTDLQWSQSMERFESTDLITRRVLLSAVCLKAVVDMQTFLMLVSTRRWKIIARWFWVVCLPPMIVEVNVNISDDLDDIWCEKMISACCWNRCQAARAIHH